MEKVDGVLEVDTLQWIGDTTNKSWHNGFTSD